MRQITAWSLSRLQLYERCPLAFKCKHILKLPDPGSPAMQRGTDIHSAAENYIRGRLKAIPPELKLVAKDLSTLRDEYKKGQVKLELELGFNRSWNAVAWMAKDVWLRVKMDVMWLKRKVLHVIDWKTGRLKDNGEYSDQLEIYAVAGLALLPEIREVRSHLKFTDHGKTVSLPAGNRNRDDFLPVTRRWEKRAAKLLNEERWQPKQNHGCKWCAFSKSKGGPCKY
jgi:PD-(D/E)XK nuclease superfamily